MDLVDHLTFPPVVNKFYRGWSRLVFHVLLMAAELSLFPGQVFSGAEFSGQIINHL